ncbi:hypothetical protein VC83_07565 [Pseudogymnoascus destructans]|uniref:Pyridoxamine 5'-phosphate oxidase N-terminal domain-containing protein n=2 Tax=Pseudogymnoascus destructans TaxID=655981 RepID=L8GB77_PSED2|nr:uncharacterized protein VC83_07565 [Pseudogymnoascus destructans]ELR10104.1 hypothetical protein GMDG_04504 [Pseudogymnoascus destructans 20631-21]OAF55517.2 hypothetical protein VC83_07565 [Pseudogymnoascus destructans]
MGKFYDQIDDNLSEWAVAQSVFFTASAPTSGKHVNVSPKGLPSSSLAILSPNQVAYVDATGSGNETISHIYENGRVTIMFCSFDAAPRIMRFFCTGRVIEWDDKEFDSWLAKMGNKKILGARAVIVLDVFKVQTSCGFGVPKLVKISGSADDEEKAAGCEYGFEDRDTIGHWAKKKMDKNALFEYQQNNNHDSLDGLAGLKSARRDRGELMLVADVRAWMRKVWGQKDAMLVGFMLAHWIYVAILVAGHFSLI